MALEVAELIQSEFTFVQENGDGCFSDSDKNSCILVIGSTGRCSVIFNTLGFGHLNLPHLLLVQR